MLPEGYGVYTVLIFVVRGPSVGWIHVWSFFIRHRCIGVRFGSHCAAGLRRPRRRWRASCRRRRQFPVERNQLGVQRAGEPKVACIIGGQTRCLGEVQRSRVIDGDGLHSQPMRQPESGAQSLPLAWLAPDLDQADVSQFEVKQGGAANRAPSSRSAIASASGSANSRAASAEASTTLMPVTVGPDDRGQVGRRAEAKAPDLRKELGGT